MVLDPSPWQTPPSGGQMSEAEYFELDERTFDRKYEYLNGIARLMSGGSIAHAVLISRSIYVRLSRGDSRLVLAMLPIQM